eukprot:CAMPEP_0176386246 /NCGR_PEP_ID=MMETSP0126-20121128/35804_1 /TAXON_ID=141414 ORGANISM="Strombidinopsis acuminatum, Strain SPMC142" /NCGR_SAMPLE_ID=MMETSP0126 /ASSEMBLY_ACC=CAM_ASM_000229 /LENGTH=138 /DNA_ID=CAMNT_0017753107 /DNA_START=267 /DNA_END=683 /DNA_ORIENTATION=-
MALELLAVIINRILDFCGGLDEEILRMNFVLIYELIDEIIDFGYPQFTDPATLKGFVTGKAEKVYNSSFEYYMDKIKLDKLKLTDSVSEKQSEKSIVKLSNDIFVEMQEKVSACFTSNGFPIHVKVNGLVFVKNYIKS